MPALMTVKRNTNTCRGRVCAEDVGGEAAWCASGAKSAHTHARYAIQEAIVCSPKIEELNGIVLIDAAGLAVDLPHDGPHASEPCALDGHRRASGDRLLPVKVAIKRFLLIALCESIVESRRRLVTTHATGRTRARSAVRSFISCTPMSMSRSTRLVCLRKARCHGLAIVGDSGLSVDVSDMEFEQREEVGIRRESKIKVQRFGIHKAAL
jgi:hypothetical protein